MIVRKIILNWITAFVIFFGLFSLGVLFFLNNQYDNGNKDFYIGYLRKTKMILDFLQNYDINHIF
ncbi:hypothetical protein [Spiroplasma endosymbiont of Colias croceus]|uniref:hypothetical protein n=1 Tax=Spiroplasma endosymbiont of Colias croceus TaxID=3066310 RepID=UPI0030CB8AAB